MAEAALTAGRAHLESAFEHTIDQGYDSRWTAAVDTAISETATTIIQVHNIKTMIAPPATAPE